MTVHSEGKQGTGAWRTWFLVAASLCLILGAIMVVFTVQGAEKHRAGLGTPPPEQPPITSSNPEARFSGASSTASSGPQDAALYRVNRGANVNDIVGHLDHQPLYLQDQEPAEFPDSEMVPEAALDKSPQGERPLLYIPRTRSVTPEVNAGFFYLKVGDGRYLKVGVLPAKVPGASR